MKVKVISKLALYSVFAWFAVLASAVCSAATIKVDGKPGVQLEILSLSRTNGDLMTLYFRLTNEEQVNGAYFSAEDVTITDPVARIRYKPIKETNGPYVAGTNAVNLFSASRSAPFLGWIKFKQLPREVSKVNIEVTSFAPIEDVPITDGPYTAGISKSKTGTLVVEGRAGERIELLSLKRTSDKLTTLTFRLYNDEKATGIFLSPDYFKLIDPIQGIRYKVIRDTTGKAYAGTNGVNLFSAHRGEASMGWIKFPGLPDSLEKANLEITYFPPIEDYPLQ